MDGLIPLKPFNDSPILLVKVLGLVKCVNIRNRIYLSDDIHDPNGDELGFFGGS